VDQLIRDGEIFSQMATSLINDGMYTRDLVEHLLVVADAIIRAGLPPGEALSEEMALQIEDIANIACSMEGAHGDHERRKIRNQIEVIRRQREKGVEVYKSIKQARDQ